MRDTLGNDLIQYAILFAIVGLYWLPTLVACARGHWDKVGIAIFNFFFGWTMVGWVGALVWAVRGSRRRGRA